MSTIIQKIDFISFVCPSISVSISVHVCLSVQLYNHLYLSNYNTLCYEILWQYALLVHTEKVIFRIQLRSLKPS